MGVLEVAVLLLGVAAIASVCGYVGSAVQRRRRQRAGRVFVLGFLVGALVVKTTARLNLLSVSAPRVSLVRGRSSR